MYIIHTAAIKISSNFSSTNFLNSKLELPSDCSSFEAVKYPSCTYYAMAQLIA